MVGAERAAERLADVRGAEGRRQLQDRREEEGVWVCVVVRAVRERGGDRCFLLCGG